MFGHETVVTIVWLASRAWGFRLGDRVALHHSCGFAIPRAIQENWHYVGYEPAGDGYAEYVRFMRFVLPDVAKIPQGSTFEEGVMLESVNTVLKVVSRLPLQRGDTVLVVGLGSISVSCSRGSFINFKPCT